MSDWERLGHLVRERRDALGLSQGELGPSAATWRNVEHAIKPPFRRKTLLAIERALRWMPNSIDRILEGGEPEEAWEPPRRVIRHEPSNLEEFDNWHEFVHEPSVPADQLDQSTPTVQSRGEERILPPEMEARFEALEREVAELRAELAEQRNRNILSHAERADPDPSPSSPPAKRPLVKDSDREALEPYWRSGQERLRRERRGPEVERGENNTNR